MFYRRRRSGINYQKVPTAGLYAEIRYLEKQKAENKDLFIKYDQFFPIYKRKFLILRKKINILNQYFKDNIRIKAVKKKFLFFFKKEVEDIYFETTIAENKYLDQLKEIIKMFHICYDLVEKAGHNIINQNPSGNRPEEVALPSLFFHIRGIPSRERIADRQGEPGTGIHYKYTARALKLFIKVYKIQSSKRIELNAIPSKEYYSFYKNLNEQHDKALRKIELVLRRRKKGKEKIENVGYVYVLSNEAYPNTYKIGSTYGLPEERAEELTGTGHLTPFKVVYTIKVQSAEYYEKNIHKLLKKYRVKEGREFFKLDLNKIKDCLKEVLTLTEKGKKKIEFGTLKNKINLNERTF
jgi:hypothetical protein|tara:strand:+ start:62 stop:1120 length:1059 start_codon:yes stop_codon:yes gene_type:complete